MAISKILHMKDSGNSFHARHLKRALDYVMNPEKTQGGRLVGAINCQADMAFEQMMDTKKQFGKTDKRQGYHIILSSALSILCLTRNRYCSCSLCIFRISSLYFHT